MTPQKFLDEVYAKSEIDYGLALPPTTSRDALEVLTNHFLGEDWYTTMPMCDEQVITEIVVSILEKTQPNNFLQRLFNLKKNKI